MLYESYYYGITSTEELYHHGIKGQKWGVRRYQNADGTLTALGKQRYGYSTDGLKSANDHADALNKISALGADTKYIRRKNERKLRKINKKRAKIFDAGEENTDKGLKALSKLERKASKSESIIKQTQATSKQLQQMTEDILSSAHSKGYTVHSKNVVSVAAKGKILVTSMLIPAPWPVTLGASAYLNRDSFVRRKKYQVNSRVPQ